MEDSAKSDELAVAESKSFLGSWFNIKWRPTSMAQLAAAEARVLQHVKSAFESFYVRITGNRRIWTLKVDPKKPEALPIVMVHGFGAGSAIWLLNVDAIGTHRSLYAFDILGFGRSSRPTFSTEADVIEEEFVNSIEEWREGVGLEKFILLGHSFGGFLAASYSLKHPDRVQHLILADPWGFAERTEKAAEEQRARIPVWMRAIGTILLRFNPLSPFRAAGPWGPRLIRRARPDLQAKFVDAFEDFTVIDYLYHCNAQPPSAETAFGHLQIPYGFARNAMLPRMTQLREDVPITFIFGGESWMDSRPGKQIKVLRRESYVDVTYIKEAGHHVYADQPDKFNRKVVWVCNNADRAHQSETTQTIMETSI
ncbi:(Lyso)-N-acylphosphatidylethanolamine lipase-like isoform X2 [Branchiostoma lanceolatum]|uniref:(Lyso)-N-acylphosphatidylethanolamine lipase-like isoform X2 n=1 Tax=Branchiostoma lanceolatum TaxID=7740 RepID=UPI0034511824